MINVLFWSRSRDQDEFWATNINGSTHFLRYYRGVAMFCPLNSHKIKRSRALKWSNQTIKDDFYWSRFLIPVANVSTGDAYVTAPWSLSCDELIIGFLQPSGFSTEFASGHYEYTVQVKCSYRYWRHSNACCSQLCWCSGNEPHGQLIHTWLHICVRLCFHAYIGLYM